MTGGAIAHPAEIVVLATHHGRSRPDSELLVHVLAADLRESVIRPIFVGTQEHAKWNAQAPAPRGVCSLVVFAAIARAWSGVVDVVFLADVFPGELAMRGCADWIGVVCFARFGCSARCLPRGGPVRRYPAKVQQYSAFDESRTN